MRPETRILILILGPTGGGKSAAGIRLAKDFDGEIINCDSMQVYRGFDIGTDKPPAGMRAEIPHHLLDIADPATQFTAADFAARAIEAASGILERGKLPFVVGGTGLYFKALLDGLFPGPGRDDTLRRELEKEAREKGLDHLRKKLEEVDPAYLRRISRNDRRKIIRALEVYALTGKPLSRHFLETRSFLDDFHPVKIGLKCERDVLNRKIEERVDRMFQSGIVEEVRALLAGGVDEKASPFLALGYKHVLAFLKGSLTLEEAVVLTKRDTRRYAKRQMTWFRKMEGIRWFEPGEVDAMAAMIAAELTRTSYKL